jgi:hypothetical protein
MVYYFYLLEHLQTQYLSARIALAPSFSLIGSAIKDLSRVYQMTPGQMRLMH